MIADLHVHTRQSDGSYSFEEALSLARAREISCVSFVDHDTTSGTARAVALEKTAGVLVIPGVEISAYDRKRKRKGYTDGIYGPLYRQLFKGGGIADREIEYVDVFDALRAIKTDGGRAVLAHPGQLDSYELAVELIAEGLDGVELYHESHSISDHTRIFELARRYPHLLLTGGSDDHGLFGSLHLIGEIRAPFGAEQPFVRASESHDR